MNDYLSLPELFGDIAIPQNISSLDYASNSNWLVAIYELAMSEVLVYKETFEEDSPTVDIPSDLLNLCFEWIVVNLQPFLPSQKHLFLIAFAFGIISTIEGLFDLEQEEE